MSVHTRTYSGTFLIYEMEFVSDSVVFFPEDGLLLPNGLFVVLLYFVKSIFGIESTAERDIPNSKHGQHLVRFLEEPEKRGKRKKLRQKEENEKRKTQK